MVAGPVRLGVEVLAADPGLAGGGSWAMVTNFTGVMPDLTRSVDALVQAGVTVRSLFGPEHGLRGSVQAGLTEPEGTDELTGLSIHETYGASPDELDEMVMAADVDGLMFDMQDIGVRFYTYVWTMHDLMLSAQRCGVEFMVLDRPNPLGGEIVAGPGVEQGFESFVGRVNIPLRHGLTAGELARYLKDRMAPGMSLRVVPMRGWRRGTQFEQTGLSWVPPSPNMPTPETARVFSGMGLIEGTNLSEGRGTTQPFQLVGAPFVDGRWLAALRTLNLPGVLFREAWFTPTFHKYAGQTLRGFQLHVTDPRRFDPILCGVAVIEAAARLYPIDFEYLGDPAGRMTLDLLWGSAGLREALSGGASTTDIATSMHRFDHCWAADFWLYS